MHSCYPNDKNTTAQTKFFPMLCNFENSTINSEGVKLLTT